MERTSRTRRVRATTAAGLAIALVPAARAQGPDLIEYTFNGADAVNSAVPGAGAAVAANGGSIVFASGGIAFGANDPAALSEGGAPAFLDTGWDTSLGTGDWTIGCFVDLTAGAGDPNFFQYLFGDDSAGAFRAFADGGAGDGNVVLRGPLNEVPILGGASEVAPVHLCWVYDSADGEIRSYLNGALNSVVPQAPLDIQGTGAVGFYVMGYNASSFGMRAGTVLDEFRVYGRAIDQSELNAWVALGADSPVGSIYCGPAVPNSTGQPGRILALGSDEVAAEDLTLRGVLLPESSFAYFLASQTQDLVPGFGGSLGTRCVGGSIAKWSSPSEVQVVGATGRISLAIDLSAIPLPGGAVAVAPGDTWNFQGWYRDSVLGVPESNFTDAVSVTFR